MAATFSCGIADVRRVARQVCSCSQVSLRHPCCGLATVCHTVCCVDVLQVGCSLLPARAWWSTSRAIDEPCIGRGVSYTCATVEDSTAGLCQTVRSVLCVVSSANASVATRRGWHHFHPSRLSPSWHVRLRIAIPSHLSI